MSLLEEITQITIYLKDSQARVNEVTLSQPLTKRASFDEEAKPLKERKWHFFGNLPLSRLIFLKIKNVFFQKCPLFIPARRSTPEAKFKTVLAILLAQEGLREYLLKDQEIRESFFSAIQSACHHFGCPRLVIPSSQEGDSVLSIAQALTTLQGQEASLIEDLEELNVQMAALPQTERDEILFAILNQIKRPPLTSVLEVALSDEKVLNIELQTVYAKTKVHAVDPHLGTIRFSFLKDHATSSIHTKANMQPGAKGVMNQRRVDDLTKMPLEVLPEHASLGFYSGELTDWHHVLEQILFILGGRGEFALFETVPRPAETTPILFTSLFSWNEYDKITQQRQAINTLHRKVLLKDKGQRACRLCLYHLNIPFNAFNKFPSPGETQAAMDDLNDETFLYLTGHVFEKLGIQFPQIAEQIAAIEKCRREEEFITSHELYLNQVDAFRKIKGAVIEELAAKENSLAALALKTLLEQKKGDRKGLGGMDELIWTDLLARELGFVHNKNCEHSIDRCAGANAADKAQRVFRQVKGAPYLPGLATTQDVALFKVLYSMYLVWEEPELNAALSTGFIGEKFFKNFIQKNPETTRYLISWLKRHPEMYLGLSNYRN